MAGVSSLYAGRKQHLMVQHGILPVLYSKLCKREKLRSGALHQLCGVERGGLHLHPVRNSSPRQIPFPALERRGSCHGLLALSAFRWKSRTKGKGANTEAILGSNVLWNRHSHGCVFVAPGLSAALVLLWQATCINSAWPSARTCHTPCNAVFHGTEKPGGH